MSLQDSSCQWVPALALVSSERCLGRSVAVVVAVAASVVASVVAVVGLEVTGM